MHSSNFLASVSEGTDLSKKGNTTNGFIGFFGNSLKTNPLIYRSVPEIPPANLENRPYCTGHQLRCMEVYSIPGFAKIFVQHLVF